MRKDAILSLLKKYELTADQDERIDWLMCFLKTQRIKALNDSDNISVEQFLEYVRNELHIAPRVLVTGEHDVSKASLFFKEMLKAENRSVHFSEADIPDEIWKYEVLTHVDPETACLLAGMSSVFYVATRPNLERYWINKLLAAGCDEHLLTQLVNTKTVSHYRKLYEAYCRLTATHLFQPLRQHLPFKQYPLNELWQLLCLSGEPTAIYYALKGVTPQIIDDRGWNMLHFVALSGNASLMADLCELGVDKACRTQGHDNVVSLSALSANVDAVEYAWKLCHAVNPKIILGRALLGGNIAVFTYLQKQLETKNFYLNDDANFKDGILSFMAGASGCLGLINGLFSRDAKIIPDEEFEGEFVCCLIGSIQSGKLLAMEHLLALAADYEIALPLLGPVRGVYEYRSMLLVAASTGKVAVFDRIFRLCANQANFNLNAEMHKVFYEALRVGSMPLLERLLTLCPPDVLKDAPNGENNMLHSAVKSGRMEVVHFVLNRFSSHGLDSLVYGYNIIESAAYTANVDLVFAIRRECESRGLNITVRPSIYDAFEKNEGMLAALTRPLEELEQCATLKH